MERMHHVHLVQHVYLRMWRGEPTSGRELSTFEDPAEVLVSYGHAAMRGLLVLVLLAGARSLPAQTTADLGAYISRHGIGVHVGGSVSRMSAFGRAEGGLTTGVHALGLRYKVLRPSDGAFVASVFGGRGSCVSVTLGERGTGCDGDWHSLIGASMGAELRSGSRGAVFVDAQRFHFPDGSTDIARWSFAAGYLFHISLDD